MQDPLEDRPFAWRRRGHDVHITHVGQRAAVLRHATARRFLEDIQQLDDESAQQLMARLTGNFKRGNERR